jgi:hypothetical protein
MFCFVPTLTRETHYISDQFHQKKNVRLPFRANLVYFQTVKLRPISVQTLIQSGPIFCAVGAALSAREINCISFLVSVFANVTTRDKRSAFRNNKRYKVSAWRGFIKSSDK